jgi:hypothetical protein
MPRSIIDTESSRPRLVRRRIVLWLVVLLVLAAVAYGVWRLERHTGTATLQGNSAPRLKVTPREHAT